MPLVRIALLRGRDGLGRRIGEVVYRTMVDVIDVPADDNFQVISEHSKDTLVFDPGYMDIARGDGFVSIQITLSEGRSLEKKRLLYRTLAERLERELGVRPEDVFVNLVEVKKENWSFGLGEASYAPATMEASPRGSHVQGRAAQG
jgi:phenylpyruvate tautomerase PptA (4-oxalocrotonate tautomerase family)